MGNQSTTLRPEALTDLKDSTEFSAEEIRQYYKTFMDECDSGRMTMNQDDFRELYNKYFPGGDADKFSQYVFKHLDQDHTGRVDFREFLASLSIQVKGTLEQKLEWLFQLYDIDNTGFIERKELEQMVVSMSSLRGQVLPSADKVSNEQLVDYFMEKADTDKDGKVGKEEFISAALTSKTIQRMLIGTLQASSSPFTKRKQYKK